MFPSPEPIHPNQSAPAAATVHVVHRWDSGTGNPALLDDRNAAVTASAANVGPDRSDRAADSGRPDIRTRFSDTEAVPVRSDRDDRTGTYTPASGRRDEKQLPSRLRILLDTVTDAGKSEMTLPLLHALNPILDGDGAMRDTTSIVDRQHDNHRRAGHAAHALLAFAMDTGVFSDDEHASVAGVFGDLLCDMQHLADTLKLDFDALTSAGQAHYDHEVRPPC